MLCAKFDWNWPIGSGEEDENMKKFTTKRDEEFQLEKLTWVQLRWDKEI